MADWSAKVIVVTNSIDLDDITKRPSQYWNRDGLSEIFLGLTMLVPACLFWLAEELPKGSMLRMLVPLAWLAVTLVLKWGLKALKERLVSPRGGYVVLAESGTKTRASAAALFILILAAFTILSPLGQSWGKIPGLALAVFFSVCFLVGGVQTRLPHMLVLAGIPLVTETWIYRNSLSFSGTIFLLLVTQGGALAFSGALRFWRFLKANSSGDFGA
jgi:hypothetical protein